MKQAIPDNPRHILLVRLSAIGDIVMASGLPGQLKNRWPNAKITWLCQPECASLLRHHPDVDQVICWQRGEWSKAWSKGNLPALYRLVREFRKDCKACQFDLVIDLQGLLKSALLASFSGAPHRIGLGRAEGAGFLYKESYERNLGDTQMIGSEYRYLANQLGADKDAYRMQLHPDPAAAERTAQLVDQAGGQGQYLVFCPFTTRPQKHWFNSHWRELAGIFEHTYGLPILVLGGPADIEAATQLCDGTRLKNWAGKTNLLQASEIIRHSRGVVGVDTGLTHMGHAARVPTLALFGSTCPYLNPDNPAGKVVYLDMHCAPCRRKPTCGGRFDCLRDISAEMAAQQFAPLLKVSR